MTNENIARMQVRTRAFHLLEEWTISDAPQAFLFAIILCIDLLLRERNCICVDFPLTQVKFSDANKAMMRPLSSSNYDSWKVCIRNITGDL